MFGESLARPSSSIPSAKSSLLLLLLLARALHSKPEPIQPAQEGGGLGSAFAPPSPEQEEEEDTESLPKRGGSV